MRIGIDFDNTIVCYDRLFHRVALEARLDSRRLAVNPRLRCATTCARGREDAWTEMQGVRLRRAHGRGRCRFPA